MLLGEEYVKGKAQAVRVYGAAGPLAGEMHRSMAMKTIIATIVVAGVLAGCGAASRVQWVYAQPGVSEAQRQRDEQVCLMTSVGSAEVNPLPTWGQMLNREAYNDCMRTRGYDVRLGALQK